jgi:hypothetical protein
VEDYEYIQILKNLGKTDLAMQISRSVGPDWTNWTRDAGAIDSARQKLGQAIDQIMNSTSRPATTSASSGNGGPNGAAQPNNTPAAAATRAPANDR